MLGAIIGDIVGSRFEFDPHKSKEFDLFGNDDLSKRKCRFTDDSVMTIAVAKALQSSATIPNEKDLSANLIFQFHSYGKEYPAAGYGSRFFDWLCDNEVESYGSYGNGSAMRVSPCGWYGETLEECERLARISAAVTHNHPEGIKGAVATASAIYLARTGKNKDEIRRYIEERFYPLAFEKTLDQIRPNYEHIETCQDTVPQAFVAFYESQNFEDAIRNAVSLGGDSDTLACITGSIAEAYYGIGGIPAIIRETALSFLDEKMRDVLNDFQRRYVIPRGNPELLRHYESQWVRWKQAKKTCDLNISPIYIITTMEKMERNKLGFLDTDDRRTVAFFYDLSDAQEAVEFNMGDINETIYDYAVIEKIGPGLYPHCINRWFYKFNYKDDAYECIIEPDCISKNSTFALSIG